MALSSCRKRLVWATVGAFAVCAVLPGTGQWARRTVTKTGYAIVNSVSHNGGSDGDDYWQQTVGTFRAQTERDRKAAAQMPTDFPVQLAACIGSVPDEDSFFDINEDGTTRPLTDTENRAYNDHRDERVTRKLRQLAPRFDRTPSYHAAILRYLSANAVRLYHRSDEAILYDAGHAAAIRSQATAQPPTPETVAMWHASAQSGERLEPHNAFFPFMEAAGLFAENRDADALAALHRASTKSEYNDHALEEADGVARLRAAQSEPLSALGRLTALQNVFLPHYTLLRACARLAVAKAVTAELQHRTVDGFRIRRDTRRIGTLMRQKSVTVLGSRIGSAFAYSTSLRPGGAPPEKDSASAPAPPSNSDEGVDKKEIREKARNERYETYLRRIKHANEAQAFAFEVAAQKSNQRLSEQVNDNPAYYFYLPRLFLLQFVPLFVPLLLLNAAFLLLLGGVAKMLARTPRIANGLPLPRAVRAGVASAILLPLGGTLLIIGIDEFWAWAGPELSLACAAGCVVLGRLAYWLRVRRTRLERNITLRRAIVARLAAFAARCRTAGARAVARTVGLWTLGVTCAYLTAAFLGFAANWIIGVAFNVVGDMGMPGFDVFPSQTAMVGFWTVAVTVVCIPSLLLVFFAVCSPKVGVPALVGMVRGMRGVAVPVACGLVLLTVPLFAWLACADAALNRDIDRAMHNENRYIAEISNKPLPLHKGPSAPQ